MRIHGYICAETTPKPKGCRKSKETYAKRKNLIDFYNLEYQAKRRIETVIDMA